MRMQNPGDILIQKKEAFAAKVKELAKSHYFIASIHVHTTNSDGTVSPETMADMAVKHNIFIAITDHTTIPDFSSFNKQQQERIIPGIEITSSEHIDVIAYFDDYKELKGFYEQSIRPCKIGPFKTSIPINDLIQLLGEKRCIVNVPHIHYPSDPFRLNFFKALKRGIITKKSLQRIHLIEVFNAYHDAKNLKSNLELVRRLQKHPAVGADAHTAGTLLNGLVYCRAATKKEFLKKLQKGEFRMIARKTNFLDNILPFYKQIILHLRSFIR
ncbi:MAG: PHP domain-containing protein [Nanoarchaeota archaeon]